MTSEVLELGKEYPPNGEELLIQKVLKMSQFSMENKPHPPTLRDQHPKSHGYVKGEFIAEENISDNLKVGVLKAAKPHPIWIRFSNAGSDREQNLSASFQSYWSPLIFTDMALRYLVERGVSVALLETVKG